MEEPLAEKRKFGVAAREKMSVVWAARAMLASAGAARGAAGGLGGRGTNHCPPYGWSGTAWTRRMSALLSPNG